MMPIDSTILAVAASTLFVLLGLAAAWGSLRAEVKELQRRQTVMNGSVARHEQSLIDHGERISHLEGARDG